MKNTGSLSHTKWECKYHVVFISKCRRRVIYKGTRRHLGPTFHALAKQRECRIEEGHLMPDHVHMLILSATEAFGIYRSEISEGKERDIDSSNVFRKTSRLYREKLLGMRLLCLNSRSR